MIHEVVSSGEARPPVCNLHEIFEYTVVANRTFSSVKPSIHPSNVALNTNPGTVLKSRAENSKTTPTF